MALIHTNIFSHHAIDQNQLLWAAAAGCGDGVASSKGNKGSYESHTSSSSLQLKNTLGQIKNF